MKMYFLRKHQNDMPIIIHDSTVYKIKVKQTKTIICMEKPTVVTDTLRSSHLRK